MIKRLLCPLDPSVYSKNALEAACRIAESLSAQVTGLAVLDAPGIEKSVGPVPMGASFYAKNLEKYREKRAVERIDELVEHFKKTTARHRVKASVARSQGSPSDRIVQESMFYDLVVMGTRTFFHFETQEGPGDSLADILDHSITPILAIPRTVKPEPPERVVVLFDGSLPAGRAVQRAAQLMKATPFEEEVVVLFSGPKEEEARPYLEQARQYLELHDVANVTCEWTDKSIRSALEDRWMNWADLIVAGANSKKSLRDFFLGSLTRYLIDQDTKRILLTN